MVIGIHTLVVNNTMQLIILENRHFKCGMDCSVTVEKNCCNACPC